MASILEDFEGIRKRMEELKDPASENAKLYKAIDDLEKELKKELEKILGGSNNQPNVIYKDGKWQLVK
jgi:hypothetical protein